MNRIAVKMHPLEQNAFEKKVYLVFNPKFNQRN